MSMLSDELRTTEEAYASATHSSNLRVEADRRGDADVLIAAGWSMSRIGGALLRLHSEYDSVAHPRLATAAQFGGDKKAAHAHNVHETALMLGRLKTLPSAREQLTIQALKWGIADAQDVAAKLLQWWLSQVCPECHGTKFEPVAGTGRLSAKACKICRGTGLAQIPCGESGRRLANFMDGCLHAARRDIGRRLRGSAAN
jgi:hypothetical protein